MLGLPLRQGLGRLPLPAWESRLHRASTKHLLLLCGNWPTDSKQTSTTTHTATLRDVQGENNPHGMEGAHHPLHLVPYSSPKAQNTDWFDSRTLTQSQSLGSRSHTQCFSSLFTLPPPAQGVSKLIRAQGCLVSGPLPALSFLSLLCRGQPEDCKTPGYRCGSGGAGASATSRNCNAPIQNPAWEGTGRGSGPNLVELCLLFGNCPSRRPQERGVLSEATVRHP